MNFNEMIAVMDGYLAMGVPGYDCSVYYKGKEVFRHHGGMADVEAGVPVSGGERYNLYSCSKIITVTAAMQLWERGAFSLDEKLSRYMPEFEEMTVMTADGVKRAEHPILIKDLFCMTAGFSYNLWSDNLRRARKETDGVCGTRAFMKYLALDPLLFGPGTRWNYSLCHDVLAALVEVISGKRFGLYVKESVFDVLGMKDSTFLLPEEELPTISGQYRFDAKTGKTTQIGREIVNFKAGSAYESGGAGAISTVDDYIRLLEALRCGDSVLKRETVSFMTQNRLTDEQLGRYSVMPDSAYGYGLGVRCARRPGDGITDFGWGGAAGSFLAVDPANEFTLFYAQHMLGSPNQEIRPLLYRYARKALLE